VRHYANYSYEAGKTAITMYLNLLTSLSIAFFIGLGQLVQPSTNQVQDQIQSQLFTLALNSSPSLSQIKSEVVNLPMIKQLSPSTQSSSIIGEVLTQATQNTDSPTPSPTPIPTQSGSENIPIVIGASVISGIIILTWFFLRKFGSGKNNHQ
jgi:hypothetical protein